MIRFSERFWQIKFVYSACLTHSKSSSLNVLLILLKSETAENIVFLENAVPSAWEKAMEKNCKP